MKQILMIASLSFLLSSCAKEEQCVNYSLVTESNEEAARDKCSGLANNYPASEIISTVYIGCLTSEQVKEVRKQQESTFTNNACSGVPYTIKVTVK